MHHLMHHSEAWNLVQNLDLELNLNLVRNHIIYWYRLLRERTSQTVQLSMFDAGMDLRNERPLPPEVPDKYMVPTGKYPDRLNGKWDGLIFDPTI